MVIIDGKLYVSPFKLDIAYVINSKKMISKKYLSIFFLSVIVAKTITENNAITEMYPVR